MAADPVPGAAPDEWHYSHEGVRCEVPVSRARLIGMIRARELDETSSVWCAGWEDWRTVANSEFKEYLREPGSPPPLTGAAVSNSVVWWLAFAPLAGLLIEEAFSGLTGSERGGLWFVTLFLNIGLCHLDEAKLRAAGHDTTRMGSAWLVPVYLFRRMKLLKHNCSYFAVWCIVLLLAAAAE